ncbi:MAG TPA: PilN domain-containing protein [Gaiellaceae bacterium]
MRAVNLLPRDAGRGKRTKAQNAPLAVGLALFLLVTVVVAAFFLTSTATVKDKQAALGRAKADLAVLPALPSGPTATETMLVGQQRDRLNALASALARRIAWDRVLRELATVLPDDVWLSSLDARSPASPASSAPAAPAAPGAAPTGFVINGYTYSQNGVARLLSRLAVLPDLHNVQLQSSALSKVGTQQVVQFTILADVVPPGADS